MRDATGRRVTLGAEFSVLTDTSDEEEDEAAAAEEGSSGRRREPRDELERKLLPRADAIPKTVAVPVQTPGGRRGSPASSLGRSPRREPRAGSAGKKKTLRAL